MRKQIIHYIYIALGAMLCACSGNDIEPNNGGTLCLQLSQQQPHATVLNTRAASPGLQVDIINAAGDVTHFSESETNEGLRTLNLAAGTYTLKGYSANHATNYGESELGEEKWYAETTFVVENGKMTQVALDVPMTNFGVCFQMPQSTGQWFDNPVFTATYSGRMITIPAGTIAYFDLDAGQNLTYQLLLTNSDNETFRSTGEHESTQIEAGTVYTVSYTMEGEAPQLRIN